MTAPRNPEARRTYSASEVADALGISKDTLLDQLRDEALPIPYLRLRGGKFVFPKQPFDALMRGEGLPGSRFSTLNGDRRGDHDAAAR